MGWEAVERFDGRRSGHDPFPSPAGRTVSTDHRHGASIDRPAPSSLSERRRRGRRRRSETSRVGNGKCDGMRGGRSTEEKGRVRGEERMAAIAWVGHPLRHPHQKGSSGEKESGRAGLPASGDGARLPRRRSSGGGGNTGRKSGEGRDRRGRGQGKRRRRGGEHGRDRCRGTAGGGPRGDGTRFPRRIAGHGGEPPWEWGWCRACSSRGPQRKEMGRKRHDMHVDLVLDVRDSRERRDEGRGTQAIRFRPIPALLRTTSTEHIRASGVARRFRFAFCPAVGDGAPTTEMRPGQCRHRHPPRRLAGRRRRGTQGGHRRRLVFADTSTMLLKSSPRGRHLL